VAGRGFAAVAACWAVATLESAVKMRTNNTRTLCTALIPLLLVATK
jgi:hypothetical protein